MALSHYQTLQYLSGNFIISAGSILFRKRPSAEPDSSALEICILHHLTEDEWLLPKGRKDRGETIEQAAIRETYEETGYPCHLWPQLVDDITEPVAVTIRDLGEGRAKLIFWYIALAEDGAEKVAGSQMENENFESAFLDIPTDREVVQQAVDIVKGGAKGMTLRDPSAALKEERKS
ncbi:hypothetical protein BJ912DRAFT_948032 [Pholiota molesta]|nr:hypothetical protein BJ912DRAFT_948032 [Pholiota molesta]